ncbi:MAG TPA: hypothetical protein PKA00_07935 [Saprospiraceae bacterium]|nr:hypothetical protein [Saprospiraceae bacterium]HMQ82822.1 hypothetical protein [Saprospiraceae bacterium]
MPSNGFLGLLFSSGFVIKSLRAGGFHKKGAKKIEKISQNPHAIDLQHFKFYFFSKKTYRSKTFCGIQPKGLTQAKAYYGKHCFGTVFGYKWVLLFREKLQHALPFVEQRLSALSIIPC